MQIVTSNFERCPDVKLLIKPTDRDLLVNCPKETKCCLCVSISITHMEISPFSQLHTVVQAYTHVQNGKPVWALQRMSLFITVPSTSHVFIVVATISYIM